jgi:menaquinone-dependent protoporphyrinogen oxidase
MSVLITYASKHGATKGIAERIAATLRQRGQDVVVQPVAAAVDLQPYDAFVIGSAVYMGSLMKEATTFVRRNRVVLAERPVWLFSSGPTGDTPPPEPKEIAEFLAAIRPRDHRVFGGALNRQGLSFPERIIVKGVKAPLGDFRDWDEIDTWAQHIADTLAPAATARQRG